MTDRVLGPGAKGDIDNPAATQDELDAAKRSEAASKAAATRAANAEKKSEEKK